MPVTSHVLFSTGQYKKKEKETSCVVVAECCRFFLLIYLFFFAVKDGYNNLFTGTCTRYTVYHLQGLEVGFKS